MSKSKSQVPAKDEKSLPLYQTVLFVLALILVSASFLFFSQKGQLIKGYDVDDAGITYNFATRLAQGYGIVLYPGGERVEGYSNPLWMFILAAGIALGVDPSPMAWFLGHLFGALTLMILALFAIRAGPKGPFGAALFAPLLLGTHAGFILWSLNGMENSLYIFCLIAGLYRLWRECDADVVTKWPISPFMFFLLSITRPEGIAYFAFAGFYRLITVTVRKKRVDLQDIIWVAAFLIPWVAYQIWHYLYFAWPFPNTFYAKVKDTPFMNLFKSRNRGMVYVKNYFSTYQVHYLLVLVPFAFLSKKGWRFALLLLMSLAFSLFFPVYSKGDWMFGFRFCTQTTPLIFLLFVLGVGGIVNIARFIIRKNNFVSGPWFALIIGAVFTAAAAGFLYKPSMKQIKAYKKTPPARVWGIQRRAEYFRDQMRKVRLKDYQSTLIEMDMGGMSLFSKMKLIDVGRICDVAVAHAFKDKTGRKQFAQEYILDEHTPDFAHLRRWWGQSTTIPSNPNFKRDYFYLPDDRLFGRDKSGNYVRKALFLFDEAPKGMEPVEFETGFTLLFAKAAPPVVAPGNVLWLRLFWNKTTEFSLPTMKFEAALRHDSGTETSLGMYTPFMGWMPTDDWETGQIVGEWAKRKVPKDMPEGTYTLTIRAFADNGKEFLESKPTSLKVIVNKSMAKESAEAYRAKAIALVETGDLDGALAAYDLAGDLSGGRNPKKFRKAFSNAFATYTVEKARDLIENDELDKAGDLLLKGRKQALRSKPVNALLWELSRLEQKKGQTAQFNEKWDEAYRHFTRAVTLQPHNSWARKGAEQVRALRY